MQKNKNVNLLLLLFALLLQSCQSEPVETPKSEIQLPTTQQLAQLQKGKDLFAFHCASCHNMDMITKSTAPPLGGVTNYRTKEWLYEYTRNSMEMCSSKDSIAVALFRENGCAIMSSFEFLTDEELDCIYFFVEQTALQNKIRLRPVER